MATTASVAARRGTAEADIKTAVSALAEKFGAEILDTTYHVRDIELRRVLDLENVALNLKNIVEKLPAKKAKEEAKDDEPKGKKKG